MALNDLGMHTVPKVASRGWMVDAACAGMDVDIFFPGKGDSQQRAKIALALDTCRRCPVQDECYTYARCTPIERGIWGGVTEGRRNKKRR